MKLGDPGYARHDWGFAIDDAGKLLPKEMFPEGARGKRKCCKCGCIKYVIGPRHYAAFRNPGVWKDIKTFFLMPDGSTVEARPNCISVTKREKKVESKTTSNKELADSMVIEFKEKMDSHAVDPAAILEAIKKSYIEEADSKLAELQKQKDHWLTLKHNLSK